MSPAPGPALLVVDDDPSQLKLLELFLKKQGYGVFAAEGAQAALEILAKNTISLVITDLMMPKIDGISFVAQLRADPRWKDVPVIMITAYATDEAVERSMRNGVSMTLSKPVDLQKLATLVGFAVSSG